ncbi:MAG: heme ABC exporter ATP-binding protein CcmA [Alphaproteobacteria bacterium GM202ARS2]|nr:heme ABC exporter ATP-binding protein CcmA [Alphaproteobacteria bacterium GM202ARS2]
MKKKTTPLYTHRYAVRNLTCVRGDTTLFHDISFDSVGHTCLHITGSNGSGKSSLLKILAGLSSAHSGTLCWCDTQEAPCAHHVLYVGHELALNSALTPYDNIVFWAQARQCPSTPDVIRSALTAFDVAHLEAVPCALLSAGQKKRTSLAKLLIDEDAPLWLLDEPYANLDSQGQKTLQGIIENAQKKGAIIILARHENAPERALPCDQTVTL